MIDKYVGVRIDWEPAAKALMETYGKGNSQRRNTIVTLTRKRVIDDERRVATERDVQQAILTHEEGTW